jgi:hypothetical protein
MPDEGLHTASRAFNEPSCCSKLLSECLDLISVIKTDQFTARCLCLMFHASPVFKMRGGCIQQPLRFS